MEKVYQTNNKLLSSLSLPKKISMLYEFGLLPVHTIPRTEMPQK